MITLQEINTIITRAIYPARKDELIAFVRREGYPEEVARRLETLPEHYYGSADSVMDALRALD
ncbi:MAG TPA: DUF2795 domain-containing protein [Armatimonadota bacterium]|nr:DUF2795 domain-containing protein [Armatimonadota bacterium]HOS42219.1 DUF2795 domain-containing protein [Armatimonadota bacterium]